MRYWLRSLDGLLRGRRTNAEALRSDQNTMPLATFFPLAILLGCLYGFCMGWFGVLGRDPADWRQLLASTVKLPALFLLTLLVTFPSLYVFNTLVGCRLSFLSTLRLLVGAIVVNLAVAASFGTILVFFTISTISYSFMVLLNVMLLTIAGLVGLGFLLKILRRLTILRPAAELEVFRLPPLPDANVPSPIEAPPVVAACAADDPVGSATTIFRVWIVIYGLVGAQMGWILRPFIGSPHIAFTWFRHREGNVFQSIVQHLSQLLGLPG